VTGPVKVMVVYGTRPEVIKMAPIIRELRNRPQEYEVFVCSSGQHREMLDQITGFFDVEPDLDLHLMGSAPGLAGFASRAISAFDAALDEHQPAVVLIQGDTSTSIAAALASFYRRILVGHVEAGVRTGQRFSPFPEEVHRLILTSLSTWHFAATPRAAATLRTEGVPSGHVFLTGNTVIDALFWATARSDRWIAPAWLPADKRLVLVTAHRRESYGAPLEDICHAVRALADQVNDIVVAFPVHLNPVVQETAHRILRGHPRVELIAPVEYPTFVQLMKRAALILSDSGGIQEEAPALGVPVLVLRDHTDRPEAIEVGAAKLVGTDPTAILQAAVHLLTDEAARCEMTSGGSPFGDGHASERIVSALTRAPSD
jgi:UDP-N-acetylglucosamine 2-epimerase (non-hydrolysing)